MRPLAIVAIVAAVLAVFYLLLFLGYSRAGYGPPCPPTREYAEAGGTVTWCGLSFAMAPDGGVISVAGNATDTVLWEQLSIGARSDVHIAVNAQPTLASPTVAERKPGESGLNLGRLHPGAIQPGDSIRLCGPAEAQVVLDVARWPYAGPTPWTMRLPACAPE